MSNEKNSLDETSKKSEPLSHIEALKNVIKFLKEYDKWYRENIGTFDGGTNPGGPPPPPPQP